MADHYNTITHSLLPRRDEMDGTKTGVFTVPFTHALARRGNEVTVLSPEKVKEWVEQYGAAIEPTTQRRIYDGIRKTLHL